MSQANRRKGKKKNYSVDVFVLCHPDGMHSAAYVFALMMCEQGFVISHWPYTRCKYYIVGVCTTACNHTSVLLYLHFTAEGVRRLSSSILLLPPDLPLLTFTFCQMPVNSSRRSRALCCFGDFQ